MPTISESWANWTIEEKLYMPDLKGRRGIDLFEKYNMKFVKYGVKADFGLSKNGDGIQGVPASRAICVSFEPPGNIEYTEMPQFRARFLNYLSITADPDDPHHHTIARSFNLLDKVFNTERANLVCMMSRNRTTIKGHEATDLYEYRRQLMNSWTKLFTEEEFQVWGRWDDKYRPHYKGECLYSNGLGGYGIDTCPNNTALLQGNSTQLDARYQKFPTFKYNVATENSRHPGYITEKIFTAMLCGCVPLYVGATAIDKVIPLNCFINMEGKSFEELAEIVKTQSQSERDAIRNNIWNWFHGQGNWWFSSYRMAKKLLWAMGIIPYSEVKED